MFLALLTPVRSRILLSSACFFLELALMSSSARAEESKETHPCYVPAETSLARIWKSVPHSSLHMEFVNWVEKRSSGTVPSGRFGPRLDRLSPAAQSVLKADFLRERLASSTQEYAGIFQTSHMIRLFRQNGFAKVLDIRLPAGVGEGGANREVPASDSLTALACDYVEGFLQQEISQTPLSLVETTEELDRLVELLQAHNPEVAANSGAYEEIARETWERLPEMFLDYYASTMRLRDYYQSYLEAAQYHSLPDSQTLLRPLPPQHRRAFSDSIPPSVPEYARGREQLFGSYLENDLKSVDLLLGRSMFGMRNVTSQEKILIAAAAGPIGEGRRETEFRRFDESLRGTFELILHSEDRRLSALKNSYDKLVAEKRETTDLARLRDHNKKFDVVSGALSKVGHPAMLAEYMERSKLDWANFSPRERALAQSPAEEPDSMTEEFRFVVYEKPQSMAAMILLLDALTPVQVETLTDWLSRERRRIVEWCETECPIGSNIEVLARRYIRAIDHTYLQERELSATHGRDHHGIYADFRPAQVSQIVNDAARYTFSDRFHNSARRLWWFVTDHPRMMLAMGGVLVGSMVFLAAYPSAAIYVAISMLSMSAAHVLFQAARLTIGRINPQAPFGVTGVQAGEAWTAITDDAILTLLGTLTLLPAGKPVLRYIEIRRAYWSLRLPFGAPVARLQALKDLSTKQENAVALIEIAYQRGDPWLDVTKRAQMLKNAGYALLRNILCLDIADKPHT